MRIHVSQASTRSCDLGSSNPQSSYRIYTRRLQWTLESLHRSSDCLRVGSIATSSPRYRAELDRRSRAQPDQLLGGPAHGVRCCRICVAQRVQQDDAPRRCIGRATSSPNCRSRAPQLRASAVPHRLESSHNPAVSSQSQGEAVRRWFYAFFKFSRPHTVLGSFISVVSVSLLAIGSQDIGWRSLKGLLQALIPALLMNIHIVGLNQIFDVEIDKVNKPYLPLASGEFSLQTAWLIVGGCGAAAVLMGVTVGSLPLLVTLLGSAALGLAYSVDLPLLRWKQNPLASAACILAVRAVLVQLGFFFHMKQALGYPELELTPPLLFTIAFMLFFALVIALFKDIPDVRGDRQAGVRTFSVRRGTSQVFWTCICLLEFAYTGAIVAGLTSRVLWSRVITAAAHAAMGILLYLRARRTDLQQSKSIYSCYMFVWKLFYAEYLIIPLLR